MLRNEVHGRWSRLLPGRDSRITDARKDSYETRSQCRRGPCALSVCAIRSNSRPSAATCVLDNENARSIPAIRTTRSVTAGSSVEESPSPEIVIGTKPLDGRGLGCAAATIWHRFAMCSGRSSNVKRRRAIGPVEACMVKAIPLPSSVNAQSVSMVSSCSFTADVPRPESVVSRQEGAT